MRGKVKDYRFKFKTSGTGAAFPAFQRVSNLFEGWKPSIFKKNVKTFSAILPS
jgi:hypothetical protein